MKFKQLSALALASVITISQVGQVNALSDAPQANGEYTAKINMLVDGKTEESMCDQFFDKDAEVTIDGDSAKIDIYVVETISMFPNLTEQINNVVVTDGTASIDTNGPDRVMDENGNFVGNIEGTSVSTDKITLTVPKEKLLADKLDLSANVTAMNSVQHFDLKISNYSGEGEQTPDPELPPTQTKSSTVTATVPLNESTYEVTVPQTINLGALSTTTDATTEYEVDVEMTNGNDNLQVVVSSDNKGTLTAGDDTIEFTNTFGENGEKIFTQTGTVNGELSVAASEVQGVSATTYNGTLNFNITSQK